MGHTQKTLERIMEVLEYLGEKTKMAPEPEQTPVSIHEITQAMRRLHSTPDRAARRAIDSALSMAVLASWYKPDRTADQRMRWVILTKLGLDLLKGEQPV